MCVHALVHTQGVVLGNRYIPLELAYKDVTGYDMHFAITSPMTYHDAKRLYPVMYPDAIMSTRNGIPYSSVLHILHQRYQYLRSLWGVDVRFGYKGRTYQPLILRDAGIQSVVNVESLGIPSLRQLAQNVGTLPLLLPVPIVCRHHVRFVKCARWAVELIWLALYPHRPPSNLYISESPHFETRLSDR